MAMEEKWLVWHYRRKMKVVINDAKLYTPIKMFESNEGFLHVGSLYVWLSSEL